MATIEAMATPQLVPERRLHEVIDVDALDDNFPTRRPRQRRRLSELPATSHETIIVIESDEEQEVEQAVRGNHPQGARHRRELRHFLSPPPPPLDISLPPVPPVPPQFSGMQSFPMRRRPPPFPSSNSVRDVVRPVNSLAFEVNVPAPPSSGIAPTAGPPSHHVPVMGFGGALISQYQNVSQNETTRRRVEESRRRERARDAYIGRRFTQMYDAAVRRFSVRPRITMFGYDDDDDDPWLPFFADDVEDPLPSQKSSLDRDYSPSFTHPGQPGPGFTFDFAPPSTSPSSVPSIVLDDDDSPIASNSTAKPDEASTLLVCARCLDHLILGDGDSGRHRLWGLRCGHLLDGKCVEQIMKPPSDISSKGKGKGKAVEAEPNGEAATEVSADEPTQNAKSAAESLLSFTTNSIRSRLRRRHHPASMPLPHFYQNLRSRLPGSPSAVSPPTNENRGNEEATEPPVEASYEWVCPVADCGRKHTSVCVGGKWIMDKEKGAIGIFL